MPTLNCVIDPSIIASALPIAAIVGGTIGGIAVLLVAIVIIIKIRHNRTRTEPSLEARKANMNTVSTAIIRFTLLIYCLVILLANSMR